MDAENAADQTINTSEKVKKPLCAHPAFQGEALVLPIGFASVDN